MQKTISVKNAALYVVHHCARYLFPLVITPYLASRFGPSYFGDFVIWNSCVWTASLFMEYGFFTHALKETAVANNNAELSANLSNVVTSKIILLPGALVIYIALVLLSGVAQRQPLVCLIGVAAVIGYGGSFAWYFQGRERAGSAILIEAIPQLFQFALVLIIIVSDKDVWIAALLQSLASCTTLLVSIIIIAGDRIEFKWNIGGFTKSIKDSTPFFIERLCLTLYQNASPLFLAALSAKEQVAFYSVGDKFLQGLAGLSIPLSYALLPTISRRMRSENADWKLSIRIVIYVTTATCTLGFVSFLGAAPIIRALFPPDFYPAIPVAQCFCLAACFVAYNACLANFVLVPAGHARYLILTSIVALMLSLTAQVLLLPEFGALGSAMSRTIAEICVAVALTTIAVRIVSLKNKGTET